jgi:hypothetical protein
MMPGTLCSAWTDIDWNTYGNTKQSPNQLVLTAIEDGVFTVPDKHLPGMWRTGETTSAGNLGHTFGVDGTSEQSLTDALIHGRKILPEYEHFYRTYVKGFEKTSINSSGSLLGIRETRRIMGDYMLGLNDFETKAIFEDEIGRFSYPVDIHPSKPDTESFEAFEKEFRRLRHNVGESYGIPYRCLIPKKLDNVLVAGRCISTDRYMQGSVRVMPGCFITGQACGVAAAIACENDTDTRSVKVAELQKRLKVMGGYLPNS